jgi:hypothetical protein
MINYFSNCFRSEEKLFDKGEFVIKGVTVSLLLAIGSMP